MHLLPRVFDLTKVGRGQIGYSGDAECEGGDCGSRGTNESFEGRFPQAGGRHGAWLECGGKGVKINCDDREVLGKENDESFDLGMDLSDHCMLLSFSLGFLNPYKACVRIGAIPSHGRDLLHKLVDGCRIFGEGAFDPEFGLRRDLVICPIMTLGNQFLSILCLARNIGLDGSGLNVPCTAS